VRRELRIDEEKRNMTMSRILSIFALTLLVSFIACTPSAPASTEEECVTECPTEPLVSQPAETTARPSPSDLVPRITIDELRQKMESGVGIVIVDNRHKEEYDVDRIKGAILAPLDTIVGGGWLPPPDKELILYCA
jgi:hypothetical protein